MGNSSPPAAQNFMDIMLKFRKMTFGDSQFNADGYHAAYLNYQHEVQHLFENRSEDIIAFEDVTQLQDVGFERLCTFLELEPHVGPFPCNNLHSRHPKQAFMQALADGRIQSQTGILSYSKDRSGT